eukprot:6180889-Pleurochrysis_carterae.AAC.2
MAKYGSHEKWIRARRALRRAVACHASACMFAQSFVCASQTHKTEALGVDRTIPEAVSYATTLPHFSLAIEAFIQASPTFTHVRMLCPRASTARARTPARARADTRTAAAQI